jgi:phage terminase large subunit
MGKTVACVNELALRAIYTPKTNARYAYVAPFYKQAKDVAWVYLKEATKGLAVEVRESDLRVILPNGAWITLYGADNPDALRGIYLDGVVLDEYGDSRPSLWEQVILPTLTDRRGWAVFIGTPKGKNHFYHVHQRAIKDPNWFSMTVKASESGILNAEDLKEIRAMSAESDYLQEFECDFTAAVKGTYYADQIRDLELTGQIGPHENLYNPEFEVYASMDLGRKDSTAIWWWQEYGDTIDVIDYNEIQGHIIQDFIEIFRESPYKLAKLWVPHDAKAKTVQTRRSSIEQLQDAGLPAALVPSLSRQQGIDAARLMLPRCRIDSVKCFDGVEALRAYKREYNELTKAFSETPKHDWASDGADSFRYLSLVAAQKRAIVPKKAPTEPVKPEAPTYTLDQLFKQEQQQRALSLVRRRI